MNIRALVRRLKRPGEYSIRQAHRFADHHARRLEMPDLRGFMREGNAGYQRRDGSAEVKPGSVGDAWCWKMSTTTKGVWPPIV